MVLAKISRIEYQYIFIFFLQVYWTGVECTEEIINLRNTRGHSRSGNRSFKHRRSTCLYQIRGDVRSNIFKRRLRCYAKCFCSSIKKYNLTCLSRADLRILILVLLGGPIKIFSLTENQFLRMTLPECTAPNALLRIKGQGIRDPTTNLYGDMLIKVRGRFFIRLYNTNCYKWLSNYPSSLEY